jgi:hypothetical protein
MTVKYKNENVMQFQPAITVLKSMVQFYAFLRSSSVQATHLFLEHACYFYVDILLNTFLND